MNEEKQETQQQVPYDPNQMVELRTEVHDLKIPTEPLRREGMVEGLFSPPEIPRASR